MARPIKARPAVAAPSIDLDAAPVTIVPLTPERWDDVAGLFGEGGDPKTCWCMYWRMRSKDWSFVCFVVSRSVRGQGLTTRLLDAAADYDRRHGAPGLEAYPVDPGEGRVP